MPKIELQSITTDHIKFADSISKNFPFSVLRLDKIHPIISGNKWFKLRFYLEEAISQQKKTILTFGGAYSNHIIATAAAAKLNGLKAIGIIRGEEPKALSHTLTEAKELGMQLIFITREDYNLKKLPDEIASNQNELYIINEGGYGKTGAEGAATILDNIDFEKYTHICCAVGTGTMLAGIIKKSIPGQKLTGISVLKNNLSINEEIDLLLEKTDKEKNFEIIHDYHFSGYAKHKPELIHFMNNFFKQTQIPTDFVYTGKLMFAVNDLFKNSYFENGSNILVIHSGGLQGNRSLANSMLIY